MSRKSSKSNAANDAQEKYSAEIREFQTAIPENKKCFECDQRGKEEFYVFKQVKKKKKKKKSHFLVFKDSTDHDQ